VGVRLGEVLVVVYINDKESREGKRSKRGEKRGSLKGAESERDYQKVSDPDLRGK